MVPESVVVKFGSNCFIPAPERGPPCFDGLCYGDAFAFATFLLDGNVVRVATSAFQFFDLCGYLNGKHGADQGVWAPEEEQC